MNTIWYLLLLEWKKFKHFRTFKVMGILYLILLPLSIIVGKAFFSYVEAPIDFIDVKSITRFPEVWNYLAYAGNWLCFLFLGFMGVLAITTEFANKTLRQNIINGVTRKEFFTAKLLLVISISLAATLYFALVGFSFGAINTYDLRWSKIISGTEQIGFYFLMCLGYMIFGMFLGVLLRRTGLALFLYIVYVIFLEPTIRWAAHGNIIFNKSLNFYPLNAIEDLSPVPIFKIIDGMTKDNNFSFLLTKTEATITTLVYISLFLFVIYYRLKKSDL